MKKVKAKEKMTFLHLVEVLESQKPKIAALKNLPDVNRHPKTLALVIILQKERRHHLRI